MKISVIDPKEDERWDEFVVNHKFGSIYHLSGWSEVLKNTFSYKPNYIIIEYNQKIKAGIPLMQITSWLTGKRLVSLPRIPFCDPLVNNEEELQIILNYLFQIVDKSQFDYLEIRTQFNYLVFNNINIRCYKHFKNHIISLEKNEEELWKSFDRSCIRQRVRRAQRDGVKIRVGKNENDLKTFYTLYKMTAKKQRIPPRPFSFFYNMWKTFHSKNLILLLIAEMDGKPGAANISFKFKNTLYYEFLGLNYDLIKHSPGHLLIWEAIQMAYTDKLKNFNFGLTPPGNKGLADFKKRWGAEERELSYFYFPDAKGYKTFIKNNSLSNELKDNFTKICIKEIKRHVSKKLYKHFG